MLLEYPALSLSIGVQDILSILEDTLKEKNWKNFELANLVIPLTVLVSRQVLGYKLLA